MKREIIFHVFLKIPEVLFQLNESGYSMTVREE
jgi:hypothetical protein